MSSITWFNRAEEALDSAKETNKPVLLDFYNPE